MKTDRLQDAFGMVRDDYVLEAHENGKPNNRAWRRWGALAACLCLVAVCAFGLPKLLHHQAPTPEPIPAPEPNPTHEGPGPMPGPDQPGPGTVIIDDPQPVGPQVDLAPVFNQVDTVPGMENGAALTGRDLTDEEKMAVVPDGLPAEVLRAQAVFYGYSDENGRVYPEEADLESVKLILQKTGSGNIIEVGIRPKDQPIHYDVALDPALYKATLFPMADVTLFQCGDHLWTDFSCSNVWYHVSAEGEEAKEDLYNVVMSLQLSVTSPDLACITPNP